MKGKRGRRTPTAEKRAQDLLRGAIDFHVHSGAPMSIRYCSMTLKSLAGPNGPE